jgi:hypothetical protein
MVYHITHKSASYLYFQNYAECALALKGIPTSVPGIEVCEGIPLLAKLADK